ncbi:MAG TPA: 4Fe-4S dicluster domain-containing protein, partial [Candidatus Hypogeohydataceae bacterium YC41]
MLNILKEIFLPTKPLPEEPDIERRQFFKEVFQSATDLVKELAKEKMANRQCLRPPGAVEELAFVTLCTRCDECIKVCPHMAIRGAGPDMGLALGSPVIIPREKPCYLCEDFPCIKACKESALIMPAKKEEVRMGLATIDKEKCIAGGFINCQSCVIACPIIGAVEMVEGKPVIHEELCTGCGLCENTCLTVNNACAIRV